MKFPKKKNYYYTFIIFQQEYKSIFKIFEIKLYLRTSKTKKNNTKPYYVSKNKMYQKKKTLTINDNHLETIFNNIQHDYML